MNTLTWLTRLIAHDTTSRYSNLALINEVADFLNHQGLQPWLAHDASGQKANLFVTLPAANGSTAGGLIFSGHTDVVPVDGQDWQTSPFCATVRDGLVYGRGAADMKGFIAAVLAAVPQMKAAKLTRPLHIALSYDEEIGCLGAPVMIDALQQRGLTPEYCIVGEPTLMQMVVAHKGIHTFTCRVQGKAAHSSLTPQGVNAIEYAAQLIGFIQQLAQRLQHDYAQDAAFDVPFSTLSVNTIQGGIASNIVPQLCEFGFDYRNLPHMQPSDVIEPIQHYINSVLLPQMHAVDTQCGIELHHHAAVPAMPATEAAALWQLIGQLVGSHQRHKVAYATEGGQFTQTGIATVICGPGSIEQAHRANEFVTLAQLARCDDFLNQMILAQTR